MVFLILCKNYMSLFMKSISLYNPIKFLAILYPTSLTNLMVEVGTRHSHQTLFIYVTFNLRRSFIDINWPFMQEYVYTLRFIIQQHGPNCFDELTKRECVDYSPEDDRNKVVMC